MGFLDTIRETGRKLNMGVVEKISQALPDDKRMIAFAGVESLQDENGVESVVTVENLGPIPRRVSVLRTVYLPNLEKKSKVIGTSFLKGNETVDIKDTLEFGDEGLYNVIFRLYRGFAPKMGGVGRVIVDEAAGEFVYGAEPPSVPPPSTGIPPVDPVLPPGDNGEEAGEVKASVTLSGTSSYEIMGPMAVGGVTVKNTGSVPADFNAKVLVGKKNESAVETKNVTTSVLAPGATFSGIVTYSQMNEAGEWVMYADVLYRGIQMAHDELNVTVTKTTNGGAGGGGPSGRPQIGKMISGKPFKGKIRTPKTQRFAPIVIKKR